MTDPAPVKPVHGDTDPESSLQLPPSVRNFQEFPITLEERKLLSIKEEHALWDPFIAASLESKENDNMVHINEGDYGRRLIQIHLARLIGTPSRCPLFKKTLDII